MAKKRIQREIRLIIILAVLSVIFFGLTFGIKAFESHREDAEQPYIDQAVMADLPDHVEVTEGSEHFVLVSEKGEWYLEENKDVPIDGLQVTDTRSVSKYFAPGRVLTGQKDNLKTFGLADPQAKVTLSNAGSSITYLIGNFNPVTNEYYVALEGGDTVYMIPKKDGISLKKPLTDYVAQPEITKASFNDINVIMAKSPDTAYIIAADGGRYLVQTANGTYEIDQAKAMEIFNSFTFSTDYRCVNYDCTEEDLKGYGLDDPAVHVRFMMASDGSEIGLKVAEGADGVHYITDDAGKIVYSISDDDYNEMTEKINIRFN